MSSDNYIRKQFQEKFHDFKAEIPPDGWERLEKALGAAPSVPLEPRRKWRYAVSAVAAIFLLILGGLLFLEQPTGQVEPLLTESDPPAHSEATALDPITRSLSAGREDEATVSEKKTKPLSVNRSDEKRLLTASRRHQEEWVRLSNYSEITIPHSSYDRVGEMVAEINRGELKTIITPLDQEAPSEELFIAATDQKGVLVEKLDKDRDQQPLLLAVGGRGALNSYQQTVNTPMTLRSVSDAPEMGEESKNTPFAAQKAGDNVSRMEHDQPISFGITVSKEIAEDLYIETGLVYSYLYSRVRNASSSLEVKETQRLHYIGVPLNVNYNVISLNKLNVYVSVGGMIEKDIYGEFRGIREGETIVNSWSEQNDAEPISQRNPQISVNAGVGLSYPIYDRLRLYGKIGGAYYFDANNKYKTIYSDRKIVMDLNVGLRYEF